MTLLERRTVISYQWWRADGGEINPEHVELLEEDAQGRISRMMEDGFIEGELHSFCGPGEVEYTGFWISNNHIANR